MSLKLKAFIVNLVLGAIVAVAVLALDLSREHGVVQGLCDGCFVAAVLLLGIGGIGYVRNRGFFDLMGYGVKSVFRIHLPGGGNNNEKETFQEYRERKQAQRKSVSDMLMAGLVYLIASFILLALYYLI